MGIGTITALGVSNPVLDIHGKDLYGFAGWAGYALATTIYPDEPSGIFYEDTPVDLTTFRDVAGVVNIYA